MTDANNLDPAESGLSAQRRTRLAAKGRILYDKSCGMAGKKTCVDGFALYLIGRGEADIARDLLAFLEEQRDALRRCDPGGHFTRADELATRIRRYLESDADKPR